MRPPASLRGTLLVVKWLELREALRAGLGVSFSSSGVFAWVFHSCQEVSFAETFGVEKSETRPGGISDR